MTTTPPQPSNDDCGICPLNPQRAGCGRFKAFKLVVRPGAVSLDRVAQQYTRVTGIATDQLWAALRQWGAATLTGREGL